MPSPDPMAGILPQSLKSLNVQKIAIVRRNGIGDLLTCYPMIQACRLQFPKAHLTLVIDTRARECAQALKDPPWDRLWIIPKGHKYVSALKMLFKIRKESFDLILNAKPKAMKLTSLLLGLSGAKIRRAVCFFPKKWFEWGINDPVAFEKVTAFEHQSLQTMAILLDSPQINPSYWPSFKEKNRKEKNSFQKKFRLYVNVTNNRESSKMSQSQLLEVIKKIDTPLHVILAGLTSDQDIINSWYGAIEESNILGEHSSLEKRIEEKFESTCQSLMESDLVLTGDGGFMHMAAAAKCPLVALFGQTMTSRWSPLAKELKILFHPKRVDLIDPSLIKQAIESLLKD